MKYLEIMWDFKEADSRRDLQAMASPLAKNPNKEDAILKPHPKGLSQISSLCVIFSCGIDIPLRKYALILEIWRCQNPIYLISTSLTNGELE